MVVTTIEAVARMSCEWSATALSTSTRINWSRSCITAGGSDMKYWRMLFFRIRPARDLVGSVWLRRSSMPADRITAKRTFYKLRVNEKLFRQPNIFLGRFIYGPLTMGDCQTKKINVWNKMFPVILK